MPRALTRPVVIVPAVVVLLLVGFGVWFWVAAGESTEVPTRAALAEYGDGGGAISGGPAAGAWEYQATGAETVGLGPFHVTRDFPPTARIVVRPAKGGYWRTLVLSEQHVEGVRMRVGPDGTRAEGRRTTLSVAGFGRTDATTFAPPPLVYPDDLAVGDTWRSRYRLREIRADATSTVLRRATATVGGEQIPVFVMRTRTVLTGALPGTRTDEEWFAPSLHMPVRLALDVDIHGTVALKEHVVMTLVRPRPAT